MESQEAAIYEKKKYEAEQRRTDESGREKRYLIAFREIHDYIIRHQLKPGDLLPSEAELSREIGVSRNAVLIAKRDDLDSHAVIVLTDKSIGQDLAELAGFQMGGIDDGIGLFLDLITEEDLIVDGFLQTGQFLTLQRVWSSGVLVAA